MDFNQLKKNSKKEPGSLPVIKIALLADSASQLLAIALKGYGYEQGLYFDIWEADYDQVYQTVFDQNSAMYTMQPDHVIIFQSVEKLLPAFYKSNPADKKQFADDQLQVVEKITETINSRLKCNIIYLNFPEINDSIFGNFANKTVSSFLYQLRQINAGLMKLATQKTNLNIADISSIQNSIGRNNFTSEKFYITTDNVIALDALPAVAKSITDIILSYTGEFKKCLILDLDNTLWGGIIGDDGMEGIEIGDLGIGKAFTRLQQWVLQLKERGIILAVCSKNDEQIAKKPFEKHPDIVLHLDDFAVFVANWNNKVDNIRHIQSILNISFSSMVFLDDNPFEREMVKKEIPALVVPDLPEDPADHLSFLYGLNLFETTSFTPEDTQRNSQYREEAARTVMQLGYTNEDQFLESLQMTADCRPVDTFTLPRAAQLTQRSNQFNLRTVRYSEERVKEMMADKNKYSLAVSLKDKFGEYGLISLVILEKINATDLFIDTWIMSCRVLKRNVEQFILNEIVSLALGTGCTSVIGEYLPTAKNGIVKDHYLQLGFEKRGGLFVLDARGYETRSSFIKSENRSLSE